MLDPNTPAGRALVSLSTSQRSFLANLPKVELHAHLNGCIPLSCLEALAREFDPSDNFDIVDSIQETISLLASGPAFDDIRDWFGLFPAIYALTSTPAAIQKATKAVLNFFLDPNDGAPPQCSYIELRTTPRATPHMTRLQYLSTVLNEVSRRDNAALIVSVDRRMGLDVAKECVELAIALRDQGLPVVGVDLCGDPTKGDVRQLRDLMARVHLARLGMTLHIAETKENSDSWEILSWQPNRLGHATFLNEAEIELVGRRKTAIEICLSSNLQTKTVECLRDHHLNIWLERNQPLVICTDDTLPFRTTLLEEYALLLAPPPLGLGLTESTVRGIAESGFQCCFKRTLDHRIQREDDDEDNDIMTPHLSSRL